MSLPGSCGQGTNLGILSYLVNINSCGLPLDHIMEFLENAIATNEDTIQSQEVPALPLPPYHITESSARLKYIDDLTMCQAVNMTGLEKISEDCERPLNYRDRTLHHLPSDKNELQKNFNDVEKFCKIQKNVINVKKTKTVIFNTVTSTI